MKTPFPLRQSIDHSNISNWRNMREKKAEMVVDDQTQLISVEWCDLIAIAKAHILKAG